MILMKTARITAKIKVTSEKLNDSYMNTRSPSS